MDAVFVLYDQMTALDLVGPYEVLASHPSVTPFFAAAAAGPVRCDSGLVLHAGAALRDVPAPDLIVVPGSARWLAVLDDSAELTAWLAAAYPAARWTVSVCTGSTLLARAGILAGRPATTHWAARGTLAGCGAIVTAGRVVTDGDVMTSAACRPGSTWAWPSRPSCGATAPPWRSSSASSTTRRRRSTAARPRRPRPRWPRPCARR